jgi:3-dehydroquinate dehydratase/shikimate dehydrogenase
LAPGQLSFEQMTEIYNYDKIHSDTEVFGVIGDPIAHSLSPIIHNAAFRKAGMNRVYIPIRIPREDLSGFIEDARTLGIRGLSVTIPHKEEILKALTWAEPTARGVGAVNTVLFGEPASVEGYNTDLPAAMESLDDVLTKTGSIATPVAGRTALVLGSGGAAKALAFGLKQRGADVVISGRTTAKAEELADSLGCGVVEWNTRHDVSASILVNCTPVGMHPNVDETPYDGRYLDPSMTVFDTIYNPENTLLIKQARENECTVVTGVDMFVRQAGLQFKLFTDRDASLPLMREVLKRTTGAAKL